MSWNQSICFLKNKLLWSGCGLVWQVRLVWVKLGSAGNGSLGLGMAGKASYDMVRFVWVRRV